MGYPFRSLSDTRALQVVGERADHRVLLPLSALGGGLFLLIADTAARIILSPAELRVGILTAMIGAPFFIYLLVRNRSRASML